MIFGLFDCIILSIIFILNMVDWKYNIIKKRNWTLYLIAFLLFGWVIPFFAVYFEVQKAIKGQPWLIILLFYPLISDFQFGGSS